MKQAAVGFRVHSGWSAFVAVSLENGAPTVLSRERIHLVETFSYKFRQPYHTAGRMPLEKARAFVAGSLSEAKRLATRALRAAQTHALIHTADGELFREALRRSSAHCGLEVACIKERELLDRGAQALRTNRDKLLRRLTELGSAFGSPWTQDEKYAALAAWLVLADPA